MRASVFQGGVRATVSLVAAGPRDFWGDETELVRAAVEWAAQRVVRPTDSKTTARAAGCFVAGGTGGNLSALAAARHAALTRRGQRPPGGWRLACTADVHSSIRIAARVLDAEILEVPGDAGGHLTGEALDAALRD